MTEKLYTIEQAAEVLQVSRSTMVRWMNTGKIHSFKIGQLRRVPESAIKALYGGVEEESESTQDPRKLARELGISLAEAKRQIAGVA